MDLVFNSIVIMYNPFLTFSRPDPNALRDLREWRARVLEGILRGVFVVCLFPLAGGIYNVIETYRKENLGTSSEFITAVTTGAIYITTVVLLAVITFARKLPYTLRAGIFLFILYALGIIGLVFSSLSGDGRIFLFAFVILAAIFFDLRYSVPALAASVFTLIVVGILQVNKIIVVPAERQINSTDSSAWTSGSLVFLALSIAGLISITYLLRALGESLTQTRIRASELERLYTAGQEMTASLLDPPALLETLARHMTEALDVTSSYIVYINQAEGTLVTLAEYWAESAVGAERTSDMGQVFQMEDYPTIMRAMLAGETFVMQSNDPNLPEKEALQFSEYGIHSMLFIPLLLHGKLLGDVEIWESRRRREFTKAEIRFAQALANRASSIIENARLFEQTRQREVELSTLLGVAQAVSSSLDLKEVLRQAATSMARILRVNYCTLSDYDPQARTIITSALYTPDGNQPGLTDEGVVYHLEDYPAMAASLESGKSVVSYIDDPDSDPAEIAYLHHDRMAASLMLPLRVHERSFGLAELFSSDPRRKFTVEEINLARAVADQAAVALENARLYEELEKRETYFRALIENSAEGVAILDAEGKIVYVAPSEERLTGYGIEEQIGASAFLYIHPDDQLSLLGLFLEGIKKPDTIITTEYRLKRKDGVWRYFEVTGHNLLDDARVAGVIINYRDITERKQAGQALKESEERYRTIFQSVSVALWEDDYTVLIEAINKLKLEGVIDFRRYFDEHPEFLYNAAQMITVLDVNDAAVKMMDAKDKAELLGPLAGIFKGATPQSFTDEIVAIAEGKTHYEHETFLSTLQGERREQWIAITLPEHAGFDRVLVSTLDITERKKMETALRESQARLEGIITSALNAIITTDSAQRIVIFNPSAQKIFGYSAAQAIGRKLDILIPQRYRENHGELVRQFGKTGITNRAKGEMDTLFGLRANGEEFPMEAFISQNDIHGEKFYTVIMQDITERKQAEVALRQHATELETLVAVSTSLRSALTVGDMIPLVIRQACRVSGAANGSIFLVEPQSGDLLSTGWFSAEADRMIPYANAASIRHAAGEGATGRVVATGEIYVVVEMHSDQVTTILPEEEDHLRGMHAGISLPLRAHDRIVGVMHVSLREQRAFTDDEIHTLTAMAEMAGNAIHRATLYEQSLQHTRELSQEYDSTLAGWARALELRDELTEGHTRRVTELSMRLARRMGLGEVELVHLHRGAILHDIGKMGIPDSILLKNGPLDSVEREVMSRHPQYAYDMLSPIPFLRPVLDIPLYHHERWDGTGYPRGIRGEEIPLVARIFAVADVWDALTSDRPYRPAWTKSHARQYIRQQAGKYFDPKIVDVFLKMKTD